LNAEPIEHLVAALSLAECSRSTVSGVAEMALAVRLQPDAMRTILCTAYEGTLSDVVVSGTFDRRVILLGGYASWVGCSLNGLALGSLTWPIEQHDDVVLERPLSPVSRVSVSDRVLYKLRRPEIVVVGLYHPEVFPLPRFPLGISDLARAVRSTMMGQISLLDMQLGLSMHDVQQELLHRSPDIIGVSATFGQHDVLEQMMEVVPHLASEPHVLFGGSLSALNREALLDRFPSAYVCDGPGEPTMQDIVAHWHGLLSEDQIRSISLKGTTRPAKRRTPLNRDYDDVLPELDLLEKTLDCNGVMQLESSRGCTHACSFCPRTHKGRWSGYPHRSFSSIVGELDAIYEKRPGTSRKIFLVDEEFVGSDKHGDGVERALGVCDLLDQAGFRWETSTRVDQVARPDRDRAWHLERIGFWAHLRDHGLSRCLFGVESGVDSVLRRFNKHSTGDQNAKAIRTLTMLGVPIRCTYITFDQLMTIDELVETYRFLGREDLMLNPTPDLSPEELYNALQKPDFVARSQTGTPFHASVSYMLVSMEALIGSPYLALLEAAGLAGEADRSMGRRSASFQDPAIGAMSDASQRWVDRSFSFDYTLKSLEKLTEGLEQRAVREARLILKSSSYRLLGRMLAVTLDDAWLLARGDERGVAILEDPARFTSEHGWSDLLDMTFEELVADIDAVLDRLEELLAADRLELALRANQVWRERSQWTLING